MHIEAHFSTVEVDMLSIDWLWICGFPLSITWLIQGFFLCFSWHGALLLEKETSVASKGRTWRWETFSSLFEQCCKGGRNYGGAVCWQTFPSVTNGFIKCAGSLGNCSFFFFCLSLTLLSCQLLYLWATSLSNLCKSLVCVIQKTHQAKCCVWGFPSSIWGEEEYFSVSVE